LKVVNRGPTGKQASEVDQRISVDAAYSTPINTRQLRIGRTSVYKYLGGTRPAAEQAAA
jgi:hypothetical protein